MYAVKPVRARMLGFRRIDALIEQHGVDEKGNALDGEAELLEHILARVIEGESLEDIAGSYDVAYGAMWRWISGEKYRMGEYESALRGHADKLVHETKGIADESKDPKLMIDTRKWLSGKWDANRFSERSKVEVSGSVSLISLLGSLKDIEGEVERIDEVERIEGESGEIIERFNESTVTSPEKNSGEKSENEVII